MQSALRSVRRFIFLILLLAPLSGSGAQAFRVATFNVENYLESARGTRPAKSPEAKAKVRDSIRALNADVLALQEIGGTNALLELCASLKSEGIDYPFWEHVTGYDTNIFVAVLSKFPIVARRSHSTDSFLLHGRRFRISRGFAEIDIQVNARYQFTLFAAHLKSRRPIAYADQEEMREEEAIILREKISARIKANPKANLVVLGDLNDLKNSRAIRTLIGTGNASLVDTRPAEQNGDSIPAPDPKRPPRRITWTHYYEAEDTYSRVDYILISRAMAREWLPEETYVLNLPNWGLASDHRPVVAGFLAEDK